MRWIKPSPIGRIACVRLRRDRRGALCTAAAIFFSMLLLSMFVFFELGSFLAPASASLPFTAFMGQLRLCLRLSAAFLILLSAITVRLHGEMRAEEQTQIGAVLAAVGATGAQKRRLIRVEMLILYLPPVALGVLAGILPGVGLDRALSGGAPLPSYTPLLYTATAGGLMLAALLFIRLCHVRFPARRTAVIGRVRRQNRRASEERHGYRQSETFRRRSLWRRLAQKSTDYHAKAYGRIALSLAVGLLYPIQAVLILWSVGNTDVVLDADRWGGVDTSAMSLSAFRQILLLLGVCFVSLAVAGLLQAALMCRAQIAARRRTAGVYRAVGLSQQEIRGLWRREIYSVLLRAAVIVLFAALIMGTAYGMVGG